MLWRYHNGQISLDFPCQRGIVPALPTLNSPQPINMSEDCHPHKVRLELVYANLILRLWVGLRLLMAGLDKFRPKGTNIYDFTMESLKANVTAPAKVMAENTFIPPMMVSMFFVGLAIALIVVGAWVIIGLFSRTALLFAGLIFVALSFGLMALPDDVEAVYRGIEVGVTGLALMTAGHSKISLDGIFFRGKKCCAAKTEDNA
jgi:thiosulfate dehydrogenase [quinone] large subunit